MLASKKSRPTWTLVLVPVGDHLAGDRHQVVAQRDHVVRVPPHAAADVQQHLGQEAQHGRQLVGQRLGRVVVARRPGTAACRGWPRSRGRTRGCRPCSSRPRCRTACPRSRPGCASDPSRLGEHRVQAPQQPLPRPAAVGGRVPSCRPAPTRWSRTASRARGRTSAPMRRQAIAWSTQNCRTPASALASVMPSAALGCEKHDGLKSRPTPVALGPRQPAGEVVGFDGVAIDLAPAELAVDGVQVQPVLAGQQAVGEVQVGPQLGRRAGLAGVVAGGDQPAAEGAGVGLEAADVVALPAVERDRDPLQSLRRPRRRRRRPRRTARRPGRRHGQRTGTWA